MTKVILFLKLLVKRRINNATGNTYKTGGIVEQQPVTKGMSLKILLLAGSGLTEGIAAGTERVLRELMAPSQFEPEIIAVTTMSGAKAVLGKHDFDLAILSANVRQSFEEASEMPVGVTLIDFIRDPQQRNRYTPIVITSSDRRSVEQYASKDNAVYAAATGDLATRESAALVVGKALGGPALSESLIKPFREAAYKNTAEAIHLAKLAR